MGMPGHGRRRSFGVRRPQTSPLRFLELAAPRRLCPRLRTAGKRFTHEPRQMIPPAPEARQTVAHGETVGIGAKSSQAPAGATENQLAQITFAPAGV